MAHYQERMLELLHAPEDGKETPLLSDGGKFKHYRRKKTNKAPRKRTFIANMTKAPTILTDALASTARGTGKGVGGTPPPASLSNPGPSAGSVPAAGVNAREVASAGLHNMPVMYPPVVYGSKHVPTSVPTTMAPPAAAAPQNFFYDAELAAALAEYQPTPGPTTTIASTAFRTVSTTLDQLPPSTMARSICTALEPLDASAPKKATTTTTSALASPRTSAPLTSATSAPAAIQRSASMGAGMASAGQEALLLGQAAAAAAAAAASAAASAASAGQPSWGHHAMQGMHSMAMQNSVSSPFVGFGAAGPVTSAPGMPAPSAMQVCSSMPQQLNSQASASASFVSGNDIVRVASGHSSRSANGTPVVSGSGSEEQAALVQGIMQLPQAGRAAQGNAARSGVVTAGPPPAAQQPQQVAPAQPLLVLPLDPAGWSGLPPRAAPKVSALSSISEDEQPLYNPSYVACHTLLDTGAYGQVMVGSLQTDEAEGAAAVTAQGLRPSPFVEVAVKLLRPSKVPTSAEAQAQVLRSFAIEAELLPSLSHPNVVPVWYVNADPAAGAVCLIQELASLGTLADYIHGRPRTSASSVSGQAAVLAHRQRVEAAVLGRVAAQSGMSTASLLQRLGGEGLTGPASEKRRRLVLLTLLRDVAAALSYLASLPQPVVHRDVKPANVLISAQGKALLADFGVAKLTGGPAPVAMGWGDEPPAKRSRSSSSSASGGSSTGWRSAGNSPAVTSAAVTWSPVPAPVHSSEDTDWMEALLNEDLPISAVQAMDVMDAMAAPGAEPDTLGWLQDLLGQDDMPVPAPASAPAAPAPAVVAASPVMSASMHGSMSGHGFGGQWASGNGSEVHTGAWSGASAGSQQPSALDHDLQGTAHYAAPEDLVVGGNGYALGPKADVFSLAYCIWEALSAQRPWAGMRSSALVTSVATKGARLPINRGWSLQLQGLLRRAWQADPAARPSAQEATGLLEAEVNALVGAF